MNNYSPKYTDVSQISMDMFCETINQFQNYSEEYTIFEIGSRDGIDSKKMKSYFKNSDVYAFEAAEQEYNNHKDQNRNINWINLAIYNYDGEIDFNLKGYLSGVHSIRDRESISGTLNKIKCKRIDTFCIENNIKSIDFVKIDVEGCTYEILQSFGNYLKDVKFLHIETERYKYFKDQFLEDDVFKILNDNFTMLEKNIRNEVYQSDSIWINNIIIK